MSLTHPTPRTAAAVVPVLASTVYALVLRRRLELARRDPLTGLRTRAGWSEQAERMLHVRQGRRAQVAVLLLDLDGFKEVNDTYGHAAGDELLAAVAARLDAWCGSRGVAGRLGGDEFVAVVRLDAAVNHLPHLLLELQAAIGRPVAESGTHPRVGGLVASASIGVACTGDYPGADLPRLLERADAAMYVAKHSGGGTHHRADQHLPEAPTVHGRRQGRPGASTTVRIEDAA